MASSKRKTKRNGASSDEKSRRSGYLSRPDLESRIRELLENEGMAVLCAGAGMGKTFVFKEILRKLRKGAWGVVEESLAGMDGEEASEVLLQTGKRITKDVGRTDERVLFAIDDVPAFDEADLEQIAGIFKALRSAGVALLLCMRPDAEDLATKLSAPIVGARELVVGSREFALWNRDGIRSYFGDTWELTCGVPALVAALCPRHSDPDRKGTVPYEAKYIELLKKLVCDVHMDEERKLKCAMVLLGKGTMEDLERICGRVDGDMFAYIQRDEPFFGVEAFDGSFHCAGASEEYLIAPVCEALSYTLASFFEIKEALVKTLFERGDYRRAACVVRCGEATPNLYRMVLAYAGEMVDAGNVSLVGTALKEHRGRGGFYYRSATLIRDSVTGDDDKRSRGTRMPEARNDREAVIVEQVKLFREVRRQLMGKAMDKEAVMIHMGSTDVMLRALATLAFSLHLLFEGRVAEVFRAMLVDPDIRNADGLVRSLNCIVFEYARCRVGDRQSPEDAREVQRATDFLLTSGFEDLFMYRTCMRFAALVLSGRGDSSALGEQVLVRAQQRGDAAVSAILYYLCALCDLGEGFYTRASVRAERALKLGNQTVCKELASLAKLVQAISEAELGGRQHLMEITQSAKGFDSILASLCLACMEDDEVRVTEISSQAASLECPFSHIPVLRMALKSCKNISRMLSVCIPYSWRVDIDGYEDAMKRWFDVPERSGILQLHSGPGPATDIPRISVRMLGEFDVRVGDVFFKDTSWGRSSSRSVFALLCAAEKHEVGRVEVLRMLWPGLSYERGRGNIYAALTALRSALGGTEKANEYLDAKTGTIRLITRYVDCDIDEFEATVASMREDTLSDAQMVTLCKRIMTLYRGDLRMPKGETSNLIEARRRRLRQDYLDALVSGAKAAYRSGMYDDAIWFARSSYDGGDLREDMMVAYMRSLLGSNRGLEARQVYHDYARRLDREFGITPSSAIRVLFEDEPIDDDSLGFLDKDAA